MSFTKSYLIPIGDMSLDDRKGTRANTDQVLINTAPRLAIRDMSADLVIRDSSPNVDLSLAAQDDWLVAGAGVVAAETAYTAFALPQDKLIAFFGLGVENAPPGVSRVRFTLGAASGEVRGYFHLEQLYSRLETAGYFSEPIHYIRNEFIRILVMARIAFAVNTQRIHLMARTLEPIGVTVAKPSV